MKIMHLTSGGDVGGAKTQVLTMLQELSKKHKATLVCFVEGPFSQEARELGIHTIVFNNINPLHVKRELLKEVQEGGYDILHCHGSKANFFGMLMRKKLHIPVVSTVHSDPKLDYMGRPLANATYGLANRVSLRYRDGWVAVSDSVKELLIGYGYDADRIRIIYNGIAFPQNLSYLPRTEYLQGLGIDWDEDCVIYGIAARLSPVKDVPTLIRAFASAVKSCPNIRLLIAGDGEQCAELETMAKEMCPADTVRFIGWQTDMNSFYHSVNVNMLSSISEAFPYAITEGARMCCATISTAVGGVPKVVEDEKTGFLVEPGDWEKMARRIVQLAQDQNLRSYLGRMICDKVRREFSAEVMAQKQVEFYAGVIHRYQKRKLGRYGAIVCGAYGKGNIGDDAILLTIIRQLRQQDPNLPICVMTRKAQETAVMTGVSTVPIFNFLRAGKWMKKSALYVSGGGTLIQNVTSTRSLLYYLFSIAQAKKSGCKVMMYGCGAGPVRGRKYQQLVAKILNRSVDRIALRDPESEKTLRGFGVTVPEISVTADPAVQMRANRKSAQKYLQSNGVDPDGKYCLFVLRPWEDAYQRLEAIRMAAEYGWNQYGMMPLFFCFEPSQDGQITREAASLLRVPYKILSNSTDCSLLCGVIAEVDLVVAMRLHALVFACSQNTKMVGISYDPKVSGFMAYMKNDNCVPLNHLKPEILCKMIDQAVSQQQSTMDTSIIRGLAEENGRIAGKML